MNKNTLPMLAGAVAAAFVGGSQAKAQELPRGGGVLERPRPELDPLGLRAGSFLIFPRIEAGVDYNDNVFATENNTEEDFIYVIAPSVNVRSDFSRHALGLTAAADIGRFQDFSSENYSDWSLVGTGRLDITRDSALSVDLREIRDHEGRTDPDAAGVRGEPVEYYLTGGGATYQQRFGRFSASIGGGARSYDYEDVDLGGGLVLDEDNRDRTEFDTVLRVGYLIRPGYEAFVRGRYLTVDRESDPTGVNRDSDGYEISAGTRFDLTNLLTGEVFAGYLTRDYEDDRLEDFSGLGFGASLDWSFTQLTTVHFTANREIREAGVVATGGGASSYVRSVLGVSVDHELLRNLILSANAAYQWDEFEGIDRTDNYYTLGFGGTYRLNRNFYLKAGYSWDKRNSDVPGLDYTNNIISLRIGAQI
ncbi:MAG TPA: outer membrane beta-barrel protein [Azospirillaceae bacterium]|nr:outer membrane beta-barrel protein [Azospirillaceae bacterium]